MVRVYIHGRPQGQDIWCKSPAQDDEFYLNPFLDSKIGEDMNAVLQVDMWHQNAYYSYIHRRNVVEKGNRPNAYFALTVCFERQYCTQVATLYELLETIYKQLCLNNIIEKSGDQEHFLVAQFQEKESVLVQITNIIQQNIEKYISNSSETIKSKQDTISTQIKSYSTVDVDSPQFITDCLAQRVLVSPSIMTKDRLPQELQQKIIAIEAQKAEVLKEKNRWQLEAEHSQEENTALTRKQKELQEQVAELQKQINFIKDEVRREYQAQIKQLQNDRSTLQSSNNNLNNQLRQERSAKTDLLNQVEDLKKRLKQLQNSRLHDNRDNVTEPDDETPQPIEVSAIVELKNFFRRMAGRFPHIWSQLALAVNVLNTGILVILLVILLGNAKTRNDGVLENSKAKQDTTIEQSTDTINNPHNSRKDENK
ncbi:MAG: hypothetical protein ACI3ZX_02250 [Candidatus Aphodosoma sp.]